MSFFEGFFTNFHFLRPMLLLALIPAALLFVLLQFLHSRQSAWSRAIEPALLPYLLDRAGATRGSWHLRGVLAVWVLGVAALAGPVWQELPMPVQEREDALVVVADLSLSMNANDVSPNRTTRLRRKIVDVINSRREEGLTALVVYAGDAHTVVPLTDDVETIANLVPALDPGIMPLMGSKPATGVRQALDLLANAGMEGARILLITDGIEASDLPALDNLMAGATHDLAVLGIGTAEGAPIPMPEGGYLRDERNGIVIPKLDRALLRDLASLTGGRYADALLTDEDIDYLLEQGLFEQSENLAESDREFDNWYEAGPWLLLLALPLAAMAFRQGWLLSFGLVALVFPGREAQALEWEDLWKTRDQRASEIFEEENFEQAARLFEDPAWRGAANYRRGDYEQAAADLALLDDPESHYNRGNALAHLNRFEEALQAYDRTLAMEPDHQDAIHNREIVQSLLEQQQQEQQQQQQGEGQNEEQQQQQQQDGEQQQDQQQQSQQQQQQDQSQESGEQQQQQSQQDQQNQEQGEEQQNEENEEEQQEQLAQESQEANESGQSEEDQSMEQWLRRIPDDPGELLRNKFEYQTLERLRRQLQNPGLAAEQAGEKIW